MLEPIPESQAKGRETRWKDGQWVKMVLLPLINTYGWGKKGHLRHCV